MSNIYSFVLRKCIFDLQVRLRQKDHPLLTHDLGVRITVVERTTHMQVYAGSNPTSINNNEVLFSKRCEINEC